MSYFQSHLKISKIRILIFEIIWISNFFEKNRQNHEHLQIILQSKNYKNFNLNAVGILILKQGFTKFVITSIFKYIKNDFYKHSKLRFDRNIFK